MSRSFLHDVTRKRMSQDEKRGIRRTDWDIKNSAQVGPEGQTRLVSATMCYAGFPT
jgi:hypothetical protein